MPNWGGGGGGVWQKTIRNTVVFFRHPSLLLEMFLIFEHKKGFPQKLTIGVTSCKLPQRETHIPEKGFTGKGFIVEIINCLASF